MFKIKVTNVNEKQVRAFIRHIGKNSDIGVKKLVRGVAMEVTGVAKENAPVGTPESTGVKGYVGGALRQSGRYKIAASGLRAKVEFTVKYASPQEFGWTTKKGTTVEGKFFLKKGEDAGLDWLEKNRDKALKR